MTPGGSSSISSQEISLTNASNNRGFDGKDDPRIGEIKKAIDEVARKQQHGPGIGYVDYKSNLNTALSLSNTIIYGRRGSGKSSLLFAVQERAPEQGILPLYVDCERYKTQSYPNILIRVLLNLLRELEKAPYIEVGARVKAILRRPRLKSLIGSLETTAQEPDVTDIDRVKRILTDEKTGVQLELTPTTVRTKLGISSEEAKEVVDRFKVTVRKLDYLENKLEELRSVIRGAFLSKGYRSSIVLLDDFYLVPVPHQPRVIDYIHRLCKGNGIFFKCATIRFRTVLYTRSKDGSVAGVQPGADAGEIDLDYTLENFDTTYEYEVDILAHLLGKYNLDPSGIMSTAAMKKLVWGSGGVPRDLLRLFRISLDYMDDRVLVVDKKGINQAAARYFQDKISELDTEFAESTKVKQALDVLLDFCIGKIRRTAFLVENVSPSRSHPVLNHLVDYRLVHLVSRNATMKHHSTGQTFSGFILDLGAYAPRLRQRAKRKLQEVDILRHESGRADPDAIRELPESCVLNPDALDKFMSREDQDLLSTSNIGHV